MDDLWIELKDDDDTWNGHFWSLLHLA